MNYNPIQLLLLNIITGNPLDFDFLPFIEIMIKNDYFTNTSTDCSWYWDEKDPSFFIKEKVVRLLINYDTVLQRIDEYRKQSKSFFSFVAPPDNINYSLLANKQKKLETKKLRTGKYIDLSIKRPQLVSTSIDTIKKFDNVIKENNQQKAILRKKVQSKRK